MKKTKLILLDFDGVMTDDRVIVNEQGIESVIVSRADGLGVNLLKDMGIKIVIVSTEENPVVSARAKKLKVEVIQNVHDKGVCVREYIRNNGFNTDETIFVGNDINDIPAMKEVGVVVVPHDAYQEVKDIADLVLETSGGRGVVRELAMRIQNDRM